MDKEHVLPPDLIAQLAECLQEGLGLNIADGPADLYDYHVCAGFLGDPGHPALDLVCDMGDDLDRPS